PSRRRCSLGISSAMLGRFGALPTTGAVRAYLNRSDTNSRNRSDTSSPVSLCWAGSVCRPGHKGSPGDTHAGRRGFFNTVLRVRCRSVRPAARPVRQMRLEGLYTHQLCPCQNVGKPLLQVDGLVMPSLVELCTPHLVHPLVVGAAEGHRRPEAKVEIAKIFEGSY